METVQGRTVSDGIAIGRIFYYRHIRMTAVRHDDADVREELLRYEEAKIRASSQLRELFEKASKEAGAENAAIFKAHQALLEDEAYGNFIIDRIRGEKVNAEYAAALAGEYFERLLSGLEDEDTRERAADVRDVTERLLRILSSQMEEEPLLLEEPVIVMAGDLSPSETIRFDRSRLLGFLTEQGSLNCHMAILARSMSLPALTAIIPQEEWDGKMVILDGQTGTLYVDPDSRTMERMKRKKEQLEQEHRELLSLIHAKDETADGIRVKLYANIGNVADAKEALSYHAAGIGLFRSEFLYLGREDYPSEEEQFQAYRQVAEQLDGKEVIIRTLDIGADKQAEYFGLGEESNPALGFRAIRICLMRPEILKTQLRAIYRASAYGRISVMFPMIASLWEVQEAKRIAGEVREELNKEGVPMGQVALGIMIETPAAAVMSDVLAHEAEFFSIGTNDLLQYTLAVDRQNEKLEPFYDARHPAVLRLIEQTVKNAHAAGCTVGICGEMGADPELTEIFLRMGVDELSVSPSALLKIRQRIREIRLDK